MPARRAVLVAAASAAAGAMLIGGGATYAAWSDADRSPTTTITAGTLTAEITQSGPNPVKTGTNPSIIRPADSKGIVPGVQAQRWTYTVKNAADSATPAVGTLAINGSASSSSDYAAMRHYLRASATVAEKPVSIPNSAFTSAGFTHSLDLGKPLKPGESVTIVLDISMPATAADSEGKPVDVALELVNRRSAGNSIQSVFTMENSAQLKQANQRS